jgi:hypothetical protein
MELEPLVPHTLLRQVHLSYKQDLKRPDCIKMIILLTCKHQNIAKLITGGSEFLETRAQCLLI